MSAFVVDQEHVHLLVYAALVGPRDGEQTPADGGFPLSFTVTVGGDVERARVLLPFDSRQSGGDLTPDDLGGMWFAHNVRSVMTRYPDTLESGELPGCGEEWRRPYRYRKPAYRLTCAETMKAIACINEQCEHDPDWRSSPARRLLHALQERVACVIPGVSEAPFCWSTEDVARAIGARG